MNAAQRVKNAEAEIGVLQLRIQRLSDQLTIDRQALLGEKKAEMNQRVRERVHIEAFGQTPNNLRQLQALKSGINRLHDEISQIEFKIEQAELETSQKAR